MKNENYFLGLDIGTDSVGYAVTNEEYDLLKHKGEPMWGVHLFEGAALNDERRSYRSARRRLDRKQQRVKLLQEIFAKEIANVDENFYRRIKESALWRDDAQEIYCLFNDHDYTDVDYYNQFPTIHHLICELIYNKEPHDVRLVYLACAWLLAHRGHFFSDVSKDNVNEVLDVKASYNDLMEAFGEEKPWNCEPEVFGDILKKQLGVNAKYKELCMLLFNSTKAPKIDIAENETYFSVSHVLKLLCGSSVSAKDIFAKEEYDDIPSFTLGKSDEELAQIFGALGDDAEIIIKSKALYDWALLADIFDGADYISSKKVAIYNQHKNDLSALKKIVRKYVFDSYKEVFRDETKPGYASYSKNGKQEEFCKYIKKIIGNVEPEACDKEVFDDLMIKLEKNKLCPIQVTGDNRVIPYQLYWVELKQILCNVRNYLEFLNEKDEDGYVTADKILSIMEFRVPYYVGPLKEKSEKFNHWMVRKAEGKIYPWNFSEKVDLDRSEQEFINRMTNTCTYLPYADVLPKNSLLHEKFQVLNEINALSVYGQRVPVEIKQKIFNDLFMMKKKVTLKAIKTYLVKNNYYTNADMDTLSGVDQTIKSSLSSYHAFKNLLTTKQINHEEVECIIRQSTYTEDRTRFKKWVNEHFTNLSEDDRKYVSSLRFKDFARLSKELLCDVYGAKTNSETGEATSIIDRMWDENVNLMEILSERFTYKDFIQSEVEAYYNEHPKKLNDRMNEMCLSNAVKRPIIRTLDIVADIVKVNGCAPKKFFIEMARGGKIEDKGKRTKSRYEQLKELYAKCEFEDARIMEQQLEKLGSDRDNKLRGEKLFLYYLQFGKSMYSGKTIDIERLSEKCYDIDHIFPQSKVKDDSILNNKVLVLSEENGAKGDKYPIDSDIRQKMYGWWKLLLDKGFITAEKYKRLTRHTPFDENEEWGFINRQLVETTQSTKAVATLLKEKYPQSEIVYVKAGLVSEFRQQFDMLKSRTVNDLHHAKDAYLNIVVGNVYNGQFTRKWFLKNRDSYNLKVTTLFSRKIIVEDKLLWNGNESLGKVKNIIHNKNAIHLTRYAFCRKGGFFDQQPKSAAEGLIPLKKGLPTEKYGGYQKPTASFYTIVKYYLNEKTDIIFMPIDLLMSKRFVLDKDFALIYAKQTVEKIIGKEVDKVEFPLGIKQIKINTVLDFDGTRMCLAGKSKGGKAIIPSLLMPLILFYTWEKYIKHLESFEKKMKENPKLVYNEKYDIVNMELNLQLYDLLTEKLSKAPYSKRPNNPIEILNKGREKFVEANVFEQTKCLMQILTIFGRVSGGCDLQVLGGAVKAASMASFSSYFNNLKKNYSSVCIIYQSASGLYETRSKNLLDLL